MSAKMYDVIVLGVGGMGSATLYHLAGQGLKVCGLDRFGRAHDRGSSHGETRIIRKAYLEHPDYVPLLHRAYDLWRQLEQERDSQLLVETGLVLTGPPGSAGMQGQAECYRRHQLPHERLSAAQLRARFPQFSCGEDDIVFFDPSGGYLNVEACVEAHIGAAEQRGATFFAGEEVVGWRADARGVEVQTAQRRLLADRLVLTTGAWIGPELARLGVETQVLRKVLLWYSGPGIEAFAPERFPCFLVDRPEGVYYGFPARDAYGLKVAEHDVARHPVGDPLAVERDLLPGDEDSVRDFVGLTFKGLEPKLTRHAVCMYTMSPDGHFVLGLHPEHDNVVIGGGFSGHGFKFASVIGEILTELAQGGTSRHPIGFLGLERLL